jgi:hypothetical protein
MNLKWLKADVVTWSLLLVSSLLLPLTLSARGNVVMGKIQFKAESKIAKSSGVWVDGQYVGYMHELNGSKTILLLPGWHRITVRQDGYKDLTQEVMVQPDRTKIVPVAMTTVPTLPFPAEPALLKIAVDPSRAAVFVDGLYVGHVGEFTGLGRGMLIAPGKHRIKIALPGYQTFETDIDPIAKQKVVVKTSLARSNGPLQAPLVSGTSSARGAGGTANTSAALAH